MNKYETVISQEWLDYKHTQSNCDCGNQSGHTETMRSEGASDIEICMDCFGAKGCVY